MDRPSLKWRLRLLDVLERANDHVSIRVDTDAEVSDTTYQRLRLGAAVETQVRDNGARSEPWSRTT